MNSECTLSRQCFHGQRLELEAEVVQATVHCVLDNDPCQTIPEEIWVKVLEAAHKLGLSALRASRLAYIARRERGLGHHRAHELLGMAP
jgi:hypothetical protein